MSTEVQTVTPEEAEKQIEAAYKIYSKNLKLAQDHRRVLWNTMREYASIQNAETLEAYNRECKRNDDLQKERDELQKKYNALTTFVNERKQEWDGLKEQNRILKELNGGKLVAYDQMKETLETYSIRIAEKEESNAELLEALKNIVEVIEKESSDGKPVPRSVALIMRYKAAKELITKHSQK